MDRTKYPKDWPEISRQIREQAGNRCEFCGAPNGERIQRNAAGEWMLDDELQHMNSTEGWFWAEASSAPTPTTDAKRNPAEPRNAAETRRRKRLEETGQLELI